ncbi:MAG TPA: PQQ-binding-like beta-propeller repeat protein [Bacteroidales bacterium]|nr:PQQ-binding-like beta-propeller repeat protein [Bacteroidales bacterium]
MSSRSLIILSMIFLTVSVSGQMKIERQWPCYRGYKSAGILDNADLPETFDFNTGKNIKWKTEVPGMGLSSPVIWDDNLFITTAVSQDDKNGIKAGIYGDVRPVEDTSVHEWKLLCFDKNSGKMLWEKTSFTGVPRIKRHPKSTHANTSVATDGKYVVAFFGSEGLYCYDMKGNLQWKKDFGVLKSVFFMMKNAEWEFASSPVIHNGVLVIQCDVLENSFVAAYDLKSGKELWRTSRDEYPGWCTPNIYTNNGKPYIALNGYKLRAGYEFETGKEVWRMAGGGDIQIPTPIIGNDLIYFNSAHGKSSPIIAVKTNATGDITLKDNATENEFVKWSLPRGGSYMHTMLLYRDHLYNVDWNGMVKCFDPLTGKELWNGKLGKTESFVASPVASDGKIYIVSENGTVFVLKDGASFEQVAEIPMGDISLVAPAITDGSIFFRTQKYLFAVGEKK